MAQKKSTEKIPQKKKKVEKKEEEEQLEVCGHEEHEHDESCGCADGEGVVFKNNPARSYALFDIWFESLMQTIDEQVVPEPNKREMLFLTLSNAMLDMLMDILPEDLAQVVADNLDDYMAVTHVNKKYGVDLLATFQEEFVAKHGDSFDDDEKLRDALLAFQESYWNGKRKDLGEKSPNEAVEEVFTKYNLN